MIKKLTLSLLLIWLTISMQAQYATNFICNDCTGTSHNLFDELNAGKVVVLCWVMPCASCILPSLTTHSIVKGYETTNPGQVVMYIADDYANTNCTSLTGWVTNNGMGDATVFSNASIKMSDYGSAGMPKVVVVADYDHAVFFNANNSVNGDELKAAIDRAIDATITGTKNPVSENHPTLHISPNPATDNCELTLMLPQAGDVKISLVNTNGVLCSSVNFQNLAKGTNVLMLPTIGIPSGIYLVKVESPMLNLVTKLSIID